MIYGCTIFESRNSGKPDYRTAHRAGYGSNPSEGYDVATAEDGFSALLQIEGMPPDLIISDLNMPRMSGFELLPVVRKRFPKIKIVAMSGGYHGNDLPLGVVADGFFAKGQRAQHLLTTITGLIDTSADRMNSHGQQPASVEGELLSTS